MTLAEVIHLTFQATISTKLPRLIRMMLEVGTQQD